MLRISVNVTEKGNNTFFNARKATNKYIAKLRAALMSLDMQTLNYMREYINAHKKRADKSPSNANTGKLEEELQVDFSINTAAGFGWAIGEIEKLKKTAAHWCLHPETEIYVEKEGLIIPMSVQDLYMVRDKISRILTPWGLKDIKNVWPTNVNAAYTTRLSNYWPLCTSGEHKFLYKLNGKVLEKKVSKMPTKSLQVYSHLYSSLKSIEKGSLVENITIDGQIVELDFDLGYLVGFIAGDGHIRQNAPRLSISQKELEPILSKVTEYCQRFGYTPTHGASKPTKDSFTNNPMHWININNKFLYKLFCYFIIGVSTEKKFNNFYLNTVKDFREGILQGYNDADGYHSKVSDNHMRINTISFQLRHQLLLLASSLGYEISVCKNQKSRYTNELYVGSYCKKKRRATTKKRKCTEVGTEPQRNEKGQYMSNVYSVEEFDYTSRMLKDIDKQKESQIFYDIEVEGSLFLVAGGIVSHNSALNYGSDHIIGMTVPGEFTDGPASSGGNAAFAYDRQHPKAMKVKRGIVGINYIEATNFALVEWVKLELNKLNM